MKKTIANVLVLMVVLSVGLSGCASGPQLGEPTLLQQTLNMLPAIPIAGNNLKFYFGGDVWVAKLNGADFSAGTITMHNAGDGYILTLKQTHMSPSAIPGAAAIPGVKWIETPGKDLVLEYTPPVSIRALSDSEATDKLASLGVAAPSDGAVPASGDNSSGSPVTVTAADANDAPDLLKLDDAVKRAARGIEGAVAQGTVVVMFNFLSASNAFSEYVLEELTGELVNGKKVVFVDRRNLEFLTKELKLQASGNLSDERAQSIGRVLGARSVVSGSLTSMGSYYRFRVRVMNVETAAIQAQVSLDLQNDTQVAHLLGRSPSGTATASAASTQPNAAPASVPAASPSPAVVPVTVVFAGNGHSYLVINSSKTWDNASSDCKKRKGYLATITSSEEQQFIEELIEKYGKGSYYWAGGNANARGSKDWSWVTGEAFEYVNWAPGQPEQLQSMDRLLLRRNGQWRSQSNNENKHATIGYICEWDS